MSAITLNITKNSEAWTNMRIYRALTKETVYSGAPIADVAVATSYVDTTAVDNQVYFYGAELYNATDKTQFSVIRAATMSDFGPFASTVQANMSMTGNQFLQGDSACGLIARATLAQFSSMPGVPNTTTRWQEISQAALGVARALPTADTAMCTMMIDGKLVVLPTVSNFNYQNVNNIAGTTASSDMLKIRDYFAANANNALIDIGGWRWKIKLLTKEMVVKYPELMITSVAGKARYVQQIISAAAPANHYVYDETGGVVTGISGANGTLTYQAPSTSTDNRGLYFYYEFVGATPV